MKTKLLLAASFFFNLVCSQTTATFENFNLAEDSALNGSDLSGGYSDGNLFFPNSYDVQFGSWAGFSVSTKTDVTTPGFTNDLSCIAGEGALNSNSYAVGYFPFPLYEQVIDITGNADGGAMEGMYVNNSTYAFLSMRDGDAFAKKFGGVSGNDPDFFKLKIQKYLNGSLGSAMVEFYLADFRFSDNSLDYIVDEWTYVDLTSLGNADSLLLSFESSDTGQFGINTPTYVCLDELTTKDGPATSMRSLEEVIHIGVYPNPVAASLSIRNQDELRGEVLIFDIAGKQMGQYPMTKQFEIDVADWPSMIYQLVFRKTDGKVYHSSFVKK